MSGELRRQLAAGGLSDSATDRAAAGFQRAIGHLGDPTPGAPVAAWWVPGRIEVLGKHTDYGGGRSLLCAVERGFHVASAPRTDGVVRVIDADGGRAEELRLRADTPSRPGHWSDYPISVIRRLARDARAGTGADIAFSSSLPQASGMSSSSAFVIGCYLALSEANSLATDARWQALVPDDIALAGYLGAVENGKAFGDLPADNGVGTHGGSEDQTAILRSRGDMLSQYRFLPVEHERTVALPGDWTFVVAMSGVHAAKGGLEQRQYNRLAAQAAALLERWNDGSHVPAPSLLAALESRTDALAILLDRLEAEGPPADALAARLHQFAAECLDIIPTVTDAIARSDAAAVGPAVARSQALADSALANQIDETRGLVRIANALGAIAASAFGAGFGGSVWALVGRKDADQFCHLWTRRYAEDFPDRSGSAEFFVTRPAPGAFRLR